MDEDRTTAFRAVHPGEVLDSELKERGIRQKDFAQRIGITPSHLNELLKGKRSFTTAIAMAVEQELGINYEFWMRMQYGYEHDCLILAQREAEKQQNSRREFPIVKRAATAVL
ncbi:MAG: HigA family addiction module antidote protein [Bacteroidales bacterium]|nr:HigA family addiction module antidote protein [Bacteroidales bacterium]